MIFSLQEGPESFHDKIKQKKSLFQKNTLFWSTSRDLSKLGNFSIFRKQSIFGLLELRSGKIVNLKILKNGGGVISTSHINHTYFIQYYLYYCVHTNHISILFILFYSNYSYYFIQHYLKHTIYHIDSYYF